MTIRYPAATFVVLCAIAIGRADTAGSQAAIRRNELARILVKVQKPAVETDSDQEPPGWDNSTNRQALAVFLAKYPNTEEAFLAEEWLIFSEANTDRNLDPAKRKQSASDKAHQLEKIASQTTRSGTRKLANWLRVSELYRAEAYVAFQQQVNDVLAHIKDYESESDKQYLILLSLAEKPPSEIEPDLRAFLIIGECDQGHFDKAKALCEDLMRRFPEWSRREHIQGVLNTLKIGQNPYPKW